MTVTDLDANGFQTSSRTCRQSLIRDKGARLGLLRPAGCCSADALPNMDSVRSARRCRASFGSITTAANNFVAASPAECAPRATAMPAVGDLAARDTNKPKETVMVEVPPPAWRLTVADLAAGATAGSSVEAALYPIDTIKTRLQAMRQGGGIRALISGTTFSSLYAGVWGNLAGVIPATAIFMAVYEPLKRATAEWAPEKKGTLAPLVAGAGAGIAASIVRVPTEVVKQRMQIGQYSSAVNAIGSIMRTEGIRGMYAGYGSFLLRDLPFDAIEFLAYEQLKEGYSAMVKREVTSPEVSVIGAGAGAVTGLVTTPLDVMKTRLMTQGTQREYKNLVDCATKILQQEGPSAFLKGWQPRVVWIGIGGSVFFTALEIARKVYRPKPKYVEVEVEK
uniref:Solute carrier family 25 (Mitochondrial S-adenosylmethionine transporter), member 26 n=1 Tax=Tetraselmis sp. GSL018 TaxID=582737 RepID=A0A061SHI5_9CHLO